jgi:hypothetical protein
VKNINIGKGDRRGIAIHSGADVSTDTVDVTLRALGLASDMSPK